MRASAAAMDGEKFHLDSRELVARSDRDLIQRNMSRYFLQEINLNDLMVCGLCVRKSHDMVYWYIAYNRWVLGNRRRPYHLVVGLNKIWKKWGGRYTIFAMSMNSKNIFRVIINHTKRYCWYQRVVFMANNSSKPRLSVLQGPLA